MTTIAANLECMAADQRMTGGGPLGYTPKLRRIGSSIFGLAGDTMMGLYVLEWLETPKRDRTKLLKVFDEVEWRYEFVLLELSPSGLALWNAWGVRLPLLDKMYAVGSGSPAALEAMESGATPSEAVKRAAVRDEYTGFVAGEPDEMWLLPRELAPRRRRR